MKSVMSFGKNPNNGGSPPNERKRTITHVLLFVVSWEKEFAWRGDFINRAERINIMGKREKI